VTEPIGEPPEPTPERFAAGIETPLLVLETPDGKGVGYVVDEAGELVPIVYAHESPYDMAALRGKIDAARAARATERAAAVAVRESYTTAAAKATASVPALRDLVDALAARVSALEKLATRAATDAGRLAGVLLVCALAAATAGCSGLRSGTTLDLNEVARAYYGQAATAPVITLTGVNELTLRGSGMTLTVAAPIEQKRLIDLPRSQTAEIVRSIVYGGAAAYLGGQFIGATKSAYSALAVQPQVVRPEVVRPEVVFAAP
jgi:hypothetical protein